jgi:hypothetical protein
MKPIAIVASFIINAVLFVGCSHKPVELTPESLFVAGESIPPVFEIDGHKVQSPTAEKFAERCTELSDGSFIYNAPNDKPDLMFGLGSSCLDAWKDYVVSVPADRLDTHRI